MSIAQKVVNRPVLIAVVFSLIAIVSLYLVSNVAIDMFPEINMPMLIVTTAYPAAGPEIVEKTISRPLEENLINVGGLKNINSTSQEGMSLIMMEFDFGANLDSKMNDIRDRLDRVKGMLPDDALSPSIMRIDTTSMPILRIALRGNRGQNDLRSIAENAVQNRLEQVDGVASAAVMGGQEQIVRVELSQNRLEAYGLTITGIARSLASQNLELGAGSIVDGSRNYSIRTTGEFASIQDIAGVQVARMNGADIRLQDIGIVSMGYADETSTVYINGEPGVYLSVVKQSGTNSVEVADRVYKRLDEIKSLLPRDVLLEITQDDTTQIRSMIDELVNSAVLGVLLAMVILFIFLRNIKSTIIIGISIPLSILVTLLAMSLAGITLNMMTLTGLILGVGMIVDSSIVILENIYKFRERGAKPSVAAILGCQEVMSSIISSTLTTVCVFIPIILFKNQLGMVGIMFQDMIITVAIALSSSLLIAIFLVPVLASKYLVLNTRVQKPLKNRVLKMLDAAVEKGIQGITKGYRWILQKALNRRLVTISLVIALFLGCIFAAVRMNIAMFPDMSQDTVSVSVELPQGSKYEDTRAVMLQLQAIAIEEIKGAESIIVNVGSSGSSSMAFFNSQNANIGELSIKLNPDDKHADSGMEVQEKMRAHFADFPTAVIQFSEGMSAMLSGVDIDMTLRVEDIDQGFREAQKIKDLLERHIADLTDITIDLNEGLPQVEVVIDRGRAYDMGLNVAAIASEIAASMNGVTATTFRQAGNEYPVILQLAEEDRAKLPDLERIFVSSSGGKLVSLSNFAALEKGMGPVAISRENQSRIIHITANIEGGKRADEVENNIRGMLVEQYLLPEGITIGYEGQWQNVTEMLITFVLVISLAILLVFGVMAAQYESFKNPAINLCTIPLMLIGVVLIYLISGEAMTAMTMVGLVMLAGIVVNNGIILVDYTNLLVGRGLSVKDACLSAGESRLRPVLMTTLTTILGLVPMAFFPGQAAALTQSIGLTVIGGLTSSTVITLLFIPVLYSLLNKDKKV